MTAHKPTGTFPHQAATPTNVGEIGGALPFGVIRGERVLTWDEPRETEELERRLEGAGMGSWVTADIDRHWGRAQGWFEQEQADIAPLRERVRQVLLQAGFREYLGGSENSRPGFELTSITPVMGGLAHVEVQHVDWPDTDVRPHVTAYVTALEGAGIKAEIVEGESKYHAYWATIQVPHKQLESAQQPTGGAEAKAGVEVGEGGA